MSSEPRTDHYAAAERLAEKHSRLGPESLELAHLHAHLAIADATRHAADELIAALKPALCDRQEQAIYDGQPDRLEVEASGGTHYVHVNPYTEGRNATSRDRDEITLLRIR